MNDGRTDKDPAGAAEEPVRDHGAVKFMARIAADAEAVVGELRVTPAPAPDVSSTDEMPAQMERVLVKGGHVQKGQLLVFLAGRPGTTNLMKVHRIAVE